MALRRTVLRELVVGSKTRRSASTGIPCSAERAVEEFPEEGTKSSDVADEHADGVFGKTPDDDVGDGEEEVGLVGEVDCVLEADAG